MSYTTRYGQPQGVAYCVTGKLREAMIGEIVAINGYADHIANSGMAGINAAWKSIMEDEKKHYAMFIALLRKYDPDQYEMYRYHQDMSYGPQDPLQVYRPRYDEQLILNNIRVDIKGELEAVILYEQELADIPCEDVRQVFYQVIADEKGHAEHLTKLLIKYAP